MYSIFYSNFSFVFNIYQLYNSISTLWSVYVADYVFRFASTTYVYSVQADSIIFLCNIKIPIIFLLYCILDCQTRLVNLQYKCGKNRTQLIRFQPELQPLCVTVSPFYCMLCIHHCITVKCCMW